MTYDRASELLKLWDGHIATEFTEKTADAAVATMVPDATVNHVPVITGGQGTDKLRDFYRDHFISKMPSDVSLVPIERTGGGGGGSSATATRIEQLQYLAHRKYFLAA
eukprot:GHUV01044406.1.p3 GENE.GHUV01044406.1~~GHUV01044406.1.p3  ORF type:complete len:108 (+),score=10.48 GHUV01044406.1:924-1247(+)